MAAKLYLLSILLAAIPAAAAPFRAGAAKVDITPANSQWLMGYNARRSTGVLDKIWHRAVVMESGGQQFALVASDLCLFSPSVYDEAAKAVERETGIPRARFWWSVTHTHAAPEVGPPGVYKALLGRSDHEYDREYAALVEDALVRAVKEARANLRPARIAIGQGTSMANINRRAKDVDGQVSLGLNPDGPADRQIGVIRLEGEDGRAIAAIANYAMHGTVMSGANLLISGDAPGTVSAYLEQKVGAPVLFVNSAAGNLAPIYSVYADAKSGHLSQFRVLLGDRVAAALAGLGAASGDVVMSASEVAIATPQRAGLQWPEELPEYRERVPVRIWRINDTVIWAAPVELFCEIAMAVRAASPLAHTFYFGYTNGWLGYLPTAAAFAEGGYEPKTSVFTDRAEKDLTEGVIAALLNEPRQ
jgi:neutral ceramidase